MIYEAGSGVEKEASHESHEVSVTALPKMPPPDNFEPSRGCLLSVLYLQLCICVFDIQPVNCQCCCRTAFISMKSCFYFFFSCNSCIKLVGMTEEGCTNQRLRCARRSDMSEYLVLCPPLCQPASQISMEDLDVGMRRKFELFTNCSFQSLPIAPWDSHGGGGRGQGWNKQERYKHTFFVTHGGPNWLGGRSPQSCTVTDFEMETSNFVLFLLISIVSVQFWAIYDEAIHCQA